MSRRTPAPSLDQALADAFTESDGPARPDPALEATSELLATHGLKNWSVDDVARRSGLGRATIYRRYGSRDELIQHAVTREARRFFTTVASQATQTTPAGEQGLTDLVVNGLRIGIQLVRTSPLGDLIRQDPATAVGLIASSTLLDAATAALADLYLARPGRSPEERERQRAEAIAEALVRLALSFLLLPGHPEDEGGTHLRAMVAPLLESGRFQPVERLLSKCY